MSRRIMTKFELTFLLLFWSIDFYLYYPKLVHWLRTFQANVPSQICSIYLTELPLLWEFLQELKYRANSSFPRNHFLGENILTSYFGIQGISTISFLPSRQASTTFHHVMSLMPSPLSIHTKVTALDLALIHTGETTKVLADIASCPPIFSPPL